MVTKEQFMNGVLEYVDKEVIPVLPTSGKWGLGTAVILASSRTNEIYSQLCTNTYIRALGVIDNDGMIDANKLCGALSESARRYGKMTVNVPVIGNLTFSSDDVGKLMTYINGGMS